METSGRKPENIPSVVPSASSPKEASHRETMGTYTEGTGALFGLRSKLILRKADTKW
jgi:hypothetical protein